MAEINGATVNELVSTTNALTYMVSRYVMIPDDEKDPADSALVRQMRIAVGALSGIVEAAARMPISSVPISPQAPPVQPPEIEPQTVPTTAPETPRVAPVRPPVRR